MGKKKGKGKKFNQESVIKGAIRRVFSRSPLVQEVRRKVREDRVQYNRDGKPSKKKAVYYKCAICEKFVRAKYTSVDHKIPVIDPVIGFLNWDIYIERLFCGVENLQLLCSTCHDEKTNKERKIRALNKKTKK